MKKGIFEWVDDNHEHAKFVETNDGKFTIDDKGDIANNTPTSLLEKLVYVAIGISGGLQIASLISQIMRG